MAETEREQLRADSEARSKKWGIEVRDDGKLTPPKGYPTDPADYGDPVNYIYPLTGGKAKAALAYFNRPEDRAFYSPAAQLIILTRIIKRALNDGIAVLWQPEDGLYRKLPQDIKKQLDGFESSNASATDDGKLVGYHFSKKYFGNLSAVQAWADENITAFGRARERDGELYFDTSDSDEARLSGAETEAGVTALYVQRETKEESLETVDINGVEIFTVGNLTDSQGRTINYTREHLAGMVSAFKDLSGQFRAPVKLGHDPKQPLTDGLPAVGWLANVRLSGDMLIADLKRVPKQLSKLIQAGSYGPRSIEIFHNFKNELTGKIYKHVVAGLSMLGATLPAIGSLKDIVKLFSAELGDISVYSKDGDRSSYSLTDSGEINIDETDSDKNTGGIDDMSEKVVEMLEGKIKDLSEKFSAFSKETDTKVSEFTAQVDTLTTERDTLKAENEKQAAALKAKDGQISTFAKEKKALEADAAEAAKVSFFKSVERKITPAQMDDYKELYNAKRAGDEAKFAAWKEGIEKRDDDPALSEYGAAGGTDGNGTPLYNENEKRIRAYCKDNDLDVNDAADYGRAMIEVSTYKKPTTRKGDDD